MAVWFFIVGLCIGSFLNVIIFRLPLGFSISLPSRSACRKCRRRLSLRENIPIISFLLQRGRCLGCSSPISFRYPLVEFLCGILFLAVYRFYGHFDESIWPHFTVYYYCVLVALLLAITFIDLDHRIIPDELSFFGMAFGIVFSSFVYNFSFSAAIVGATFGGVFFGLMGWGYQKITNRDGLGFGDVKLLAMIGSFLGFRGTLLTIVVSSILGSFFGIVLMVIQKKNLKLAIPFGPFLAIGALVFLFWGEHFEILGIAFSE